MKLEKTAFAKTVRAMDHIHKAIKLLGEAGDQVLKETGNHAAANDYRYFEVKLQRVIIEDDETGLEPFIRGLKARAK
jgi:hypothetical protein